MLASVQEILAREDPAKASQEQIRTIDLKLATPLLRDIPEERAEAWAAVLWDAWHQSDGPQFWYGRVSLSSQLWLARFLAPQKPQIAADVFREGLKSRDAAIQTMTEMLLRECLGGSLPQDSKGEALVEMLEKGEIKPAKALWEIYPMPLSCPVVLTHRRVASYAKDSGRVDLAWLDGSAKITARKDGVWPLVQDVLPNGLFYGRTPGGAIALTSAQGDVFARFDNAGIHAVLASHGGLWCLAGPGAHATEFAADGAVLWQCPLASSTVPYVMLGTESSFVREVVPYLPGRILFLGHGFLDCRNRRGDVLWTVDLKGLDDPRRVVAIGEDKFLVSCKKSVGLLTKAGAYTPLVDNLRSALWIRYHPAGEWAIYDGGASEVFVYDSVAGKVTGRINLDDGGETPRIKTPR
jgi:hypothetical protein